MRDFVFDVPPPRDPAVATQSALRALGSALFGAVCVFVYRTTSDTDVQTFVVAFAVVSAWVMARNVFLYLWNARRRETVGLAEGVLTLVRQVGPLHLTRHFAATSAKVWLETAESRFEEVIRRRRRIRRLKAAVNWGPIVIQDDRGRYHRFGEGLSGAQALRVVERLHDGAHSLRP